MNIPQGLRLVVEVICNILNFRLFVFQNQFCNIFTFPVCVFPETTSKGGNVYGNFPHDVLLNVVDDLDLLQGYTYISSFSLSFTSPSAAGGQRHK